MTMTFMTTKFRAAYLHLIESQRYLLCYTLRSSKFFDTCKTGGKTDHSPITLSLGTKNKPQREGFLENE